MRISTFKLYENILIKVQKFECPSKMPWMKSLFLKAQDSNHEVPSAQEAEAQQAPKDP
jgi:hypothetical protein